MVFCESFGPTGVVTTLSVHCKLLLMPSYVRDAWAMRSSVFWLVSFLSIMVFESL